MKFEGKGKLVEVEEVQQINEKFRKRGFVVETNSEYDDILYLELFNDRCDLIEKFNIGDWIDISGFSKSRKWTSPSGDVKYFNTNSCVFIKSADGEEVKEVEPKSDLPF